MPCRPAVTRHPPAARHNSPNPLRRTPILRDHPTSAEPQPGCANSSVLAARLRCPTMGFTTASVHAMSAALVPPRRRHSRRAPHRATRPTGPTAARHDPRRTTGRPPPRRARPILSMLSRCDPPTTCSRPKSPGWLTRTHRVIAAVQRPHRSRQWFTVLGRRQRIPVGTHHDPRAAVAAHPKTGRTVAADRAHPHRAVLGLRPAHDLRLEPSQFLGMQARIHQQP